MNILSLAATFGVVVWIFHDGHLSGLLGFAPNGTINPILVPGFGSDLGAARCRETRSDPVTVTLTLPLSCGYTPKQHLRQPELTRAAGADETQIERWIAIGRTRAEQARLTPYTGTSGSHSFWADKKPRPEKLPTGPLLPDDQLARGQAQQ